MAKNLQEQTKRVNFRLAPSTVEALEEIAKARGVTLTEALRQAIGTEVYLRKATQKGAKVLLQEDGTTKELIFR